MQEISSTPSFEGVLFPRRTHLIKRLRYISFVINDITFIVAILIGIMRVFTIPSAINDLSYKVSSSPFTLALFILSGISLLFGAKRHLVSTHKDADKDEDPWWNTVIPIFLAVVTSVIGFLNCFNLTTGVLSLFHTSTFAGFCFFLVGLALIPPYTRIPHRFHVTQLLIFIVTSMNVFSVLENVYQLFSPFPMKHIIFVPLPTALIFAFFCFGILLRWTNRGFLGNFTLDSVGSILALRLFLINLVSAPLITFLVLVAMQKTSYNIYQVLTVVVVCFTLVSSTLLWVNVKLLYGYALEHLLMRESLHAHNIDLQAEKEELQKNIAHLEQEKQQYLDKLNIQEKWKSVVEAHG